MRAGGGPLCPVRGRGGGWYPARDRPAAPTVFRTPPPAVRRGEPEPCPRGWAAAVLGPGSHGQARRAGPVDVDDFDI